MLVDILGRALAGVAERLRYLGYRDPRGEGNRGGCVAGGVERAIGHARPERRNGRHRRRMKFVFSIGSPVEVVKTRPHSPALSMASWRALCRRRTATRRSGSNRSRRLPRRLLLWPPERIGIL